MQNEETHEIYCETCERFIGKSTLGYHAELPHHRLQAKERSRISNYEYIMTHKPASAHYRDKEYFIINGHGNELGNDKRYCYNRDTRWPKFKHKNDGKPHKTVIYFYSPAKLSFTLDWEEQREEFENKLKWFSGMVQTTGMTERLDFTDFVVTD